MEPLVIQLVYPILIGGGPEQLTEIIIERRVTAREMAVGCREKEEISKSLKIISELTNIPMNTLYKLDVVDTLKVVEAIGDFLTSGQ